LTSLAFIYFALAKVDVAIIETGLGGRFDATNVIRRPLACVITSIAKDHQELLGNTIEDIAFEKAGIIKNGCDVVCGKLPQKAEAIISRKSIPYVYGKNFESSNISITRAPSQKFDYKSKSLNLRDIEINMLGLHQVVNASVAVCVLELLSKKGFLVSQAAIKQGLKNSLWPGRFDIRNLIIDDKSFKIIIDGSHNIEGFNAFFDTFNKLGFAKEKRTFIFASMKEKEYEQMAKKIVPFAKRVILPYIKNDRAVNPIDLKEEFSKYISDEKLFIANSVDKALRMFDDGEIGLTIGSLYLAGEVLTTVQKYNARRSQCQKVYI
jgi:dihydrofolate synthase/folylpolyglutamate synthase